jgi:hypothetical protein
VNAPSKPMASSPFKPKTIIHCHCLTTIPTYYPKTFEHLEIFFWIIHLLKDTTKIFAKRYGAKLQTNGPND